MGLLIMIFEDDKPIRELLQAAISQLGHETLAFSDPMACPLYAEEQSTCSHEQPCADLLVTDNQMPRMTGLEFIRRQSERGCKGAAANKVVLSGAWTDAQLQEAARLGCKILQKPFSLRELTDWINEREASITRDRRRRPATVT